MKKQYLWGVMLLLFLACNKQRGNLPAFSILLTDSVTSLNTAEIPTGKPVMLVYFETDCEYCQKETKNIIDHISELGNVRFYFVAVNQLHDIKFYQDYYKMQEYPNIHIGKDTGYYMLKHYTIRKTPYMMLYDRNKILRGVMTGAIRNDTLMERIREL